MITREQFMMGRDTAYPTTEEMEVNAAKLLYRVNGLLKAIGSPLTTEVTSGYRPGIFNANYAPGSAHLTCRAIDLADANGALKAKVTEELLAKFNLWAEEYARTKTWIHLQIRPASQRIFKV